MLFNVVILTVFASVFAATFNIGDVVLIQGLQNVEYENRVAVVVEDALEDNLGQTRFPVMAWMGFDPSKSSISRPINIKPENLVRYDYNADILPEIAFDPENTGHCSKIATYAHLLATLQFRLGELDSEFVKNSFELVHGAVHKEFGQVGRHQVDRVFQTIMNSAVIWTPSK
jgi:hypothetical protein